MEIPADRATQPPIPLRPPFREQVAVGIGQDVFRDFLPDAEGEARHIDEIGREVHGRPGTHALVPPCLVPAWHCAILPPRGPALSRGPISLSGPAALFSRPDALPRIAGQVHVPVQQQQVLHRTDKIPPAGPGLDVPLAQQLPIGIVHRAPGHLEIFRQSTRRGKPLPCKKLPPSDFPSDMLIYLLIQTDVPLCPYLKCHFIQNVLPLTPAVAVSSSCPASPDPSCPWPCP